MSSAELKLELFRFIDNLPENRLQQFYDYFVLNQDKQEAANCWTKNINKENNNEELTPETKHILDECWQNYVKHPERVKPWEQVEQEIIEEFGYDL